MNVLVLVACLIAGTCSQGLAYKRNYRTNNFTIGAVFDKEHWDAELAFKYAIQWYNRYGDEGITYSTYIQKVPRDNIFVASKAVCNMTKTDSRVIAIFGPEALTINAMTQSICSKLELPHIQTSWKSSPTYPPPISLNFFPAANLLAQGFATILNHMRWKSYAVIYQHDDALIRLQGILKIADSSKTPTIVRQLEPETDYRLIFKALKDSGVPNIVLDCETDDIIKILQQAKDVSFLNYPMGYLLTSLDAHTLDYSVLNPSANITMVRLFDPSNENIVRHTQSWEVGEMRSSRPVIATPETVRTEAILMIDAVNLLIEAVNHLHKSGKISPRFMPCDAKHPWEDGHRITAYMKQRRLEKSLTGPIAFDQFGRRVNFTLQVQELNSDIIKATWSPENRTSLNFTITAKEQHELLLQSLRRQRIFVSTKLVDPYLMIKSENSGSSNDSRGEYEGYAVDLMDLIAQELNFTYEFSLTDGGNGVYDDNLGTWTGVVGDVVNGKAQLGICDLTVNHQRRQAVDFSNYFMTLGISILYRKPTGAPPNMFAFIDPLAEDVWMYTITAYVGVSLSLFLIARIAPADWENPHPNDEDPEELENSWSIGNAMWFAMGSLMTQGSDILPKSVSSRMAVTMWWFFSLLLTNSYTANMAAFLSRSRMGPSINDVDDLVAQNKIKYGTLINGSTYEFFKNSNYSKYQNVWNKMSSFKPTTFVTNNWDGVRKVLNKNQQYAFFMESSSMEYEINKHCELQEIGTWLDSKGYGIAMPIDAPYREEINNAILKFQESGTLQALKNKWWKEMIKGQPCDLDENLGKNDGSLKLENVGGVFLVLGIGVAISFAIAIVEFLWNVRNVAVQEHITYWEALVVELKFAINLWVTQKATTAKTKKKPSREVSETRSFAEKVLQGASSFLHTDALFDKRSARKSSSSTS